MNNLYILISTILILINIKLLKDDIRNIKNKNLIPGYYARIQTYDIKTASKTNDMPSVICSSKNNNSACFVEEIVEIK